MPFSSHILSRVLSRARSLPAKKPLQLEAGSPFPSVPSLSMGSLRVQAGQEPEEAAGGSSLAAATQLMYCKTAIHLYFAASAAAAPEADPGVPASSLAELAVRDSLAMSLPLLACLMRTDLASLDDQVGTWQDSQDLLGQRWRNQRRNHYSETNLFGSRCSA